MDNQRPPISERLERLGAQDLGDDPPPDDVEAFLRRWTSTLDGSDPLRIQLERDALADLPGLTAGQVDAALNEMARSDDEGSAEASGSVCDREQLYRQGRSVLQAEDQLAMFCDHLRRARFAGSTEPAELLHLAFTGGRLLDRPPGIAVRGPSSAGKTYAVERAAEFQPDGAVHILAGVSERYLAYADLDTEHAYVVISEASALHRDGVGATIIRELAWGNRLRYGTLESTANGIEDRMIEKPGPTGLVTTATGDLEEEIATRLISVHITDRPEQTKAVVDEIARDAAGEAPCSPDLDAFRAASLWLEAAGDRQVIVPFAPQLAQRVPTEDVRMRRDFEQILSVVKAHALIHQRLRPRDDEGRVTAIQADYAAAHRLLSDVLAVTVTDVSDAVRETVEKVAELNARQSGSKGVSYRELGDALGMSRQGAHYRCRKALDAGFLANVEERSGYPARLVRGEELPEPKAVLPPPDKVEFTDSSGRASSKPSVRLDTSGNQPGESDQTAVKDGVQDRKGVKNR